MWIRLENKEENTLDSFLLCKYSRENALSDFQPPHPPKLGRCARMKAKSFQKRLDWHKVKNLMKGDL